jgi:hypothetical protein
MAIHEHLVDEGSRVLRLAAVLLGPGVALTAVASAALSVVVPAS